MPDRARFVDEVHLYSTLLHEMSHWSGAKHRLDRDVSGRFGSESYAIEELIAELSASFLCANLGVAHDPRDNTATYLESWLKVLKNDKGAIITAAAKAQAASRLSARAASAEAAQGRLAAFAPPLHLARHRASASATSGVAKPLGRTLSLERIAAS